MKNDIKSIENKIILFKMGISQRELAKKLGYAESYISLLMSGKRQNKDFDRIISCYKSATGEI